MALDYASIAANAQAAIENAGTTVTLTRSTVDSFDPTLGTVVPGADLTATGSGVMTNYSNYNIDGTVIKQGDMKLLIGPELAFAPEVNDIATVDSVAWKIVNVKPITPAGIDCLYICQVRK